MQMSSSEEEEETEGTDEFHYEMELGDQRYFELMLLYIICSFIENSINM